MLSERKKRICPYSKVEFIPKRSNQKFANKECRVAYHNEISNNVRKKIAKTNKPLLNNHKIFSELLSGKNEGVFHQEFLVGKGVSFQVFTGLKKLDNDYAYQVFEFYYHKIDQFNFKIVKL
jgi:hypothetical protein